MRSTLIAKTRPLLHQKFGASPGAKIRDLHAGSRVFAETWLTV